MNHLTTNSRPARTDVASVAKALSLMFAGFRERAEDAEALTRTYTAALDDLPSWAVAKACDRFMRGKVPDRHNNAFAPSVAELHAYADGLVADEQRSTELRSPRPVLMLSEPEIPPEERARVAAKMEALVQSLKASSDMRTASEKAAESERQERWRRLNEERRVRECEAAGVDPSLGISAALYRQLKERGDAA